MQHDSTEIFIDRELIQRGIAPQDIVLGFQSPKARERLAALQPEKK
ncbi:element excision factor XisI family protein [Leptolyngbya sp. 7M]|nr:XisI protein [Leptolyngbya sp. 7M]